MKCAGPAILAFALLAVPRASPLPAKEPSTSRSPQPQIGDTIKQLTNQLMNTNASADITLDTRTPPKVKQQFRKPPKKEAAESSHPGVAEPVEESDVLLEEGRKKFNFYKIETKPTTDRGLSTWVLLNSQTVSPLSSTTKAPRKPPTKQRPENKNLTALDTEIFNKITKPLFKKRPLTTTTKKPTTTTAVNDKELKLTKIKASVLTNAINNRNKTEVKNANKKLNDSSTNKKVNNVQEASTLTPDNKIILPISTSDNELVASVESKDDDMDLTTTTELSKKARRPTTKRKKNKKRRRPSVDKADTNSTKLTNKIKEKPISTQIYNYLSREIIPTVGVGLVGLMVTAGLASYFLYPFGIARRSYEVDRKDKEVPYYYDDEYTPGGIAEEEVIGRVIAGMPENSNLYQNHRSSTSRDTYSNLRYKQNDFWYRKVQPQPHSQASVEAIYLTPSKKYHDPYNPSWNHKHDFYNPQRNYNHDIMEHSKETGYTVDVVGNLAQDMQEVTPAVVPEHGPRNLPEASTNESPPGGDIIDFRTTTKIRRRRNSEMDNEIVPQDDEAANEISDYATTTQPSEVKVTENSSPEPTTTSNITQSLMTSLKNLFEAKVRLGLEILQSATRFISRYLSEVQTRFNYQSNAKEQPRST